MTATAFIFLNPHPFDNLNSRIYDWKMSVKPARIQSPDIVHVDVDDAAVQEYGLWPWDRAISARIVEKLAEFGAKVIAFDIFYSPSGKSKEGDEAFFKAIKKAGNVVSATGLGVLTNDDEAPLELPEDRSKADALYDKSWPLETPSGLHLLRVQKMRNAALPLVPIIEGSKAVGHITAHPDGDGVYRKVALLVKLEDRCVPSLSLACLMAYWNLPAQTIAFNGNREIEIRRTTGVVRIPIDTKGMILVNWGDPWKSFKHYSVKDVLSNAPDPERPKRYKDKIVVVAVTATGNTDFGATPLSINAPLSRIHSHGLNTILADGFVSRFPVFPWIVVFSILLAIGFPLIVVSLNFRIQAALAGLICVLVFLGSAACFLTWSYDVPLAEFCFIALPAICASLFVRIASVEWQTAQYRLALEQFLPSDT